MKLLQTLRQELKTVANPEKAQQLQRFFKTGQGQYGAGDKFLGIVVPKQRLIAKKYLTLDFPAIHILLNSPLHEERLVALLILVLQNKKADPAKQKDIYEFYITHTHGINNWDLVDLSAPHIVGKYLLDKDKGLLYNFIADHFLWKRRIAMVATQHFIRNDYYKETLEFAKLLLNDKEDLMHKASGWMLREMGKRDLAPLVKFLDKYAHLMPRTMLRYAIEKFPEKQRLNYLRQKKVISV